MKIVNLRNCEDYDIYGGRNKEDGELKHIKNTEVGERGWLGNPYTLEDYTREESIELFREYFEKRFEQDANFRDSILELEDKVVACWCKPKKCHLEVIKDKIDSYTSS